MKKYSAVVMCLFFTACSLLKKPGKITDESFVNATQTRAVEVDAVIDKQTNSALLLSGTNALNTDYSIRVWPKGLFHFSPSGQFSAEADSVLFSGRQTQLSTQSAMQLTRGREVGKMEVVLQQKESLDSGKIRVEKFKNPLGQLIFFAAIVFSLVAFFAVRGCFVRVKR